MPPKSPAPKSPNTKAPAQKAPAQKAPARKSTPPGIDDDALRTVHFISLGCPKNRVDSEVMLGLAQSQGLQHVSDASQADVIVVNTCGFIGEAKKESVDAILEMAALKEAGTCRKLVVSGCLSQRHPEELAEEMPEVDHFLGSSDMLRLGDILRGSTERILVGHPADWVVRAKDPRQLTTPGASAYVKIAEGCNRTCSFCVIPQLRGKQRSRPAADILREVRQLTKQGVKEINLISQDTVSYGRDLDKDERFALAELVEQIASIRGVHWVRLFYLYPEKLTPELLKLLAEHPKVLPYVDMPLQHAADGMLRRMKRGHGGSRLRDVVSRLRDTVPNLTFRTSFIVGHPGETDEEFQELLDFVQWARFDRVGVFQYSDEESSGSFHLDAKVPVRTAQKRHRELMRVQRKIAHQLNKALVGRELDVLVEGPSEEHEYVMMGRHGGQAPEIDGQVYLSEGDASPGDIVRVRIQQAADYDLVGEILSREDGADSVGARTAGARPPQRKAGPIRLRVLGA